MRCGRRWLDGSIALAVAILVTSGVARALPTQLSRTQFETLTTGNLTTQVEDFESFFIGLEVSPLTLLNGTATFTASVPNITDAVTLCTSGKCMAGSGDSRGLRAFDAFPMGTQLWGTDFAAFASADIFDITVVGGSGTLVLDDVAASEFFGFKDSMGLTSVGFENVSIEGKSNYVFDDVTTAIPEPSTALLVGLGLVCVAGRRRGVVC